MENYQMKNKVTWASSLEFFSKQSRIKAWRVVIASLFAITVQKASHARAEKLRGPSDTGGGSYRSLLDYMGIQHTIYTNPRIQLRSAKQYQREFRASARRGINELKSNLNRQILDRAGREIFLSQEVIESLEKLLSRPYYGEGIGFVIQFAQEDQTYRLGQRKPRTASNNRKGRGDYKVNEEVRQLYNLQVSFNPIQWENIRETFKKNIAEEIFMAIATHELLSLLGIEKTDYYPVSQLLAPSLKKHIRDTEPIYRKEVASIQKDYNEAVVNEYLGSFYRRQASEIRSILGKKEEAVELAEWANQNSDQLLNLTPNTPLFGRFRVGVEMAKSYYAVGDNRESPWGPFDNPDFYSFERIHETTCFIDEELWATSGECLSKSLNDLMFNRLPPLEEEIQKTIGQIEDLEMPNGKKPKQLIGKCRAININFNGIYNNPPPLWETALKKWGYENPRSSRRVFKTDIRCGYFLEEGYFFNEMEWVVSPSSPVEPARVLANPFGRKPSLQLGAPNARVVWAIRTTFDPNHPQIIDNAPYDVPDVNYSERAEDAEIIL